jgi:hypothetical protein
VSNLRSYALLASVALIAGCGQTATQTPPLVSNGFAGGDTLLHADVLNTIARIGHVRTHINHQMPWMAAGAKASNLIYVSDIGGEVVDVFSYPDGKPMGTLTGFDEPNGLCVDGKGDLFVADMYHARLVEYAHANSKPKAILKNDGYLPIGCAVDPKTNNLAVTNYSSFPTEGTVSIFKEARGKPVEYTALLETFFCAYDDNGNLFIDGNNNSGTPQLSEFLNGSGTLQGISLNVQVGWPGGLQWDGKELAMGDQYADKFEKSEPYPNVVYSIQISGLSGTVTQTAPLITAGDVIQFSLDGSTIAGADGQNEDVGYWSYPQGGKPTGKLTDSFYEPVSAAISLAAK